MIALQISQLKLPVMAWGSITQLMNSNSIDFSWKTPIYHQRMPLLLVFSPPSPCPKIPEDVHKQGNFFKKTLFTSKFTRNFFFSPRDLKCQHYCLFVNFHTQIQDALEGSVTSFVLCHHSSYSYCVLLLLYLPFNTNSLTWLKLLNNNNKNNWFSFSRCQGISGYGQKHNLSVKC